MLMSHWINSDELNTINIFGLVACFVGVNLHVYLKATKGVYIRLSLLDCKKEKPTNADHMKEIQQQSKLAQNLVAFKIMP